MNELYGFSLSFSSLGWGLLFFPGEKNRQKSRFMIELRPGGHGLGAQTLGMEIIGLEEASVTGGKALAEE